MRSILFSTALLFAGIEAIRTEALLKQNFDDIFGDAVAEDNSAVEEASSNAYVVDENGYLYEVDDSYVNTAADELNMNYAAPTVKTTTRTTTQTSTQDDDEEPTQILGLNDHQNGFGFPTPFSSQSLQMPGAYAYASPTRTTGYPTTAGRPYAQTPLVANPMMTNPMIANPYGTYGLTSPYGVNPLNPYAANPYATQYGNPLLNPYAGRPLYFGETEQQTAKWANPYALGGIQGANPFGGVGGFPQQSPFGIGSQFGGQPTPFGQGGMLNQTPFGLGGVHQQSPFGLGGVHQQSPFGLGGVHQQSPFGMTSNPMQQQLGFPQQSHMSPLGGISSFQNLGNNWTSPIGANPMLNQFQQPSSQLFQQPGQQVLRPLSPIQQQPTSILRPIGSLSSLTQPGYQFIPTTYTAAPDNTVDETYTAATTTQNETQQQSVYNFGN